MSTHAGRQAGRHGQGQSYAQTKLLLGVPLLVFGLAVKRIKPSTQRGGGTTSQVQTCVWGDPCRLSRRARLLLRRRCSIAGRLPATATVVAPLRQPGQEVARCRVRGCRSTRPPSRQNCRSRMARWLLPPLLLYLTGGKHAWLRVCRAKAAWHGSSSGRAAPSARLQNMCRTCALHIAIVNAEGLGPKLTRGGKPHTTSSPSATVSCFPHAPVTDSGGPPTPNTDGCCTSAAAAPPTKREWL